MRHRIGLPVCLLALGMNGQVWPDDNNKGDVSQFFIDRTGLLTPAYAWQLPSGLMYTTPSFIGPRQFHGDEHGTIPTFNGISLALAPFAAPGVWLDVGRFGVDEFGRCGSGEPWGTLGCGLDAGGDYRLNDIGQEAERVALEAWDNSQAAFAVAAGTHNDVLDMGFRGSFLQGYGDTLDRQDGEVFLGVGASSLPGARSKQRTELGWLYQESTQTSSQQGADSESAELGYIRNRVQLNHSSREGNNTSETHLYYQQARLQSADATLRAIPPTPQFTLITPGTETLPPGAVGFEPSVAAETTWDAEYQSIGLRSERRLSFGDYGLDYRLAYQRDNADYRTSFSALDDCAPSDTADVLELGLGSQFSFDLMSTELSATWKNASIARHCGEASTDNRVDGWEYGLGLWSVGRYLGIAASREFTPPSPGNAQALEQTANHLRLMGQWQSSSVFISAEVWLRQFDNRHQDCGAAGLCGAPLGTEQLNLGAVDFVGATIHFSWLGQFGAWSMPVSVTLDESRGEFGREGCSARVCWQSGQSLNFLPKRQWQADVGLAAGEWSLTLAGRSSEFEHGEVVRLAGSVSWRRGSHEFYLRGDNLNGEQGISGAQTLVEEGERVVSLGYRWRG